MNKTKSLYKDPFTFFMLASTLFLAAASWLIIPPYLVLAGALYVAAVALKWSIGAGVIAALWAGISVSMAYWWQGSLPVTVVISIVLYFAIAMIVGMGMQALRRHRQILHDEKKYNQDALNSIGDPLFIIDRNYEISFANNRALEWLRSLDFNDEVIEKPLAEVMPCLPKSFFDEYRLVFETGEPIISKDSTVINGTVYHIETRKSPAVKLKGSVENVITVFKDLTGRKDAEKNTRSLVENTPDLIIRFNRELKLIFCNEAVMHNLEAPKELLLGKNILELSDNNDQPFKAMHQILKECLETRQNRETNLSINLPSERKHLFIRVIVEKDQGDNVESILVIARDINEMLHFKEQFEQISMEYETLFHGIQTALFLLEVLEDKTFRFVKINEIYQQMTGASVEGAKGKTPHELFGQENGENAFCRYQRCYELAEPISYEEHLKLLGKERSLYTVLKPVFGPKKKITHLLGSSKDVTEQNEVLKELREKEQKYRSVVESAKTIALIVTDLNFIVQEFSPGAEKIFGYNKDEITGKSLAPLHHASEVKKIASYMEQLKSEKAGLTFDTKLFRKSGEPFPASFSMEPLLNCEGEIVGTLTIAVDKSHLQEREDQLSLSEQKFKSYIDHAPDGVFVTDEKGMFKEANTMAAMITGYTRNELLSKYLYELTPSLHRQLVGDHYKLANKRGRAYGEIPYLRKDAANRFWSLNTVKVSKNDYLVYCRDITERKQNEETIKYLSYYDNLTGLQNRLYLEEEMKRLEHKKIKPISLIMADLNGLKLVNETCGHDFGDKMLRDAAEILRCSCREEDIIARWGGDEFVILLPRTTQAEAQQLCSRIKDLINNVYIESIPLSVALGVGVKEEPEQDLLHILNQAEKEMYRHKLAESRSEKGAILDALLKALGDNCYETEVHVQKMQEIALKMAESLKFSQAEMNRLALAIKIHDIGKFNIPLNLLTRAAPLDKEEWEIVKKHSETGYRIARSAEDFSHVAEDILAHHENWDGSGYPDGLKGEAIPLLARIIALADAFEVMTGGRPYRKAFSLAEAYTELKNCSGKQFDPELVDILIEASQETEIIESRLQG